MTPGELFALLVLLIGVPAMFVHRTAAVLVVAWLAGQGWWLGTGDSLPIGLYLMTDAIAFGLILSWATSKADWAVVALYPAMWLAYVLPIEPVSQWWTLYVLAAAQFTIAGPWPAFRRNRTSEGRRIKMRLFGLASIQK